MGKIQSSKSEADLRIELTRVWKRNQAHTHAQFFDIYWPEALMRAVRKVEFVKSSRATFITSEAGISMINLLPWSREGLTLMKKEREVREACALPTYSEAKKQQQQPRLPPTSWADTVALLTTYTLFLEMLFRHKNHHFLGIEGIIGQLKSTASICDALEAINYAQLCWAVREDMCIFFSESLVMDDFLRHRGGTIIYPRSTLKNIASTMAMTSLNPHIFPQEWMEAIEFGRGARDQWAVALKDTATWGSLGWRGDARRGGGGCTRGNGGGGGGRTLDDKKEKGVAAGREVRRRHLERYKEGATNTAMPPNIKSLLTPLDTDQIDM